MLAQQNCGRLSNMMFFVYNHIDTTQANKLRAIIQTLDTSLSEAFEAVQNLDGIVSVQLSEESPLRQFRLDTPNSSESDVRILGNVKEKNTPPGDVPDPSYGKALAEFREHIHRRVTSNARGETRWESRSLDQFSKYLADVWGCIASADWTLHFQSLVERSNFDQMEAEYKKCEKELAEKYRVTFSSVQKDMVTKKDETNDLQISHFISSLQQIVDELVLKLDEDVEVVVKKRGREKWQNKYEEIWKDYKENQKNHWKKLLSSSFHTMFYYDSEVEKLRKDMRQGIRELFSSLSAEREWDQREKDEQFQKMYNEFVKTAKKKYPPVDVEYNIKTVYSQSSLIKQRKIEMGNKDKFVMDMEKECEAIIERQLNENETNPARRNDRIVKGNLFRRGYQYAKNQVARNRSSKNVEPTDYQRDIFLNIHNILKDKICYDDSIVADVIKNTEEIMSDIKKKRKKNWTNFDYQNAHIYARKLIIFLLGDMQDEWEKRNSVYTKLDQPSNRAAMREYFMVASQGVERTKLFVCLLKTTLETSLAEAFEDEIIQCTTNRIRSEKWLHSGKFMQNYLDIYLIDLLNEDNVRDALVLIRDPQKLYNKVLQNLIQKKTPDLIEEYNKFVKNLKREIRSAINDSASVNSGRAACLIKKLREACCNILQSQSLGKKLMIDCGDEYKNCDNEDADAFYKSCTDALLGVIDAFSPPTQSQIFASSLSSKVVDFMITQNDPAALPRCDAHCPWCNSLCMETANHNTKLKPHDTLHQPDGLGGVHDRKERILLHTACSKYEENTNMFKGDKFLGQFKDFETIFPGWMKPKFKESWPLREYIIANYHKDIAKMYGVKPCSGMPTEYNHDLSCIRDHLQRQIQNPED